MGSFLIVLLLMGLAVSTAQARGRQPDDGFPDYNRLELHPKTPPTQAPDQETERPATPPVFTRPSLNAPVKAAGDEDVPKPPPAAVPTKDTSEPALPDDMLNTLEPSTTGQNSTK